MWFNVGSSDEIKIKRIECKHIESKERYKNFFFIISSDDNTAILYRTFGKYNWSMIDYDIRKGMFAIDFKNTNKKTIHSLKRDTGYLWSSGRTLFECFKMEDNFDPEKFLKEITKKNTLNKKKNNKF